MAGGARRGKRKDREAPQNPNGAVRVGNTEEENSVLLEEKTGRERWRGTRERQGSEFSCCVYNLSTVVCRPYRQRSPLGRLVHGSPGVCVARSLTMGVRRAPATMGKRRAK